MARELEGKIFIVHPEHNIPALAFASPIETNRVERELANAGVLFSVKETFCLGPSFQRIFILMEPHSAKGAVLAFTNGKQAQCMSKVLQETGDDYAVTEISCFAIMRQQVLAKYKLKFTQPTTTGAAITMCASCQTNTPLVKRFRG